MHITEKAYAKINLFLDVTAKRKDGFHDVKTVMHSISLNDELEISVIEDGLGKIILEIIGADELSVGEDNLVSKAARVYLNSL